MEKMLVVVFDDQAKAYQGKSALRQLEEEGNVAIYAAAVVARNADGSTSVKQYEDVEPVGTLFGTLVGSVIGLLGGPVGVAVGAVSGLAVGAVSDGGKARVDARFVDQVSKTLTPNKVAVIAQIEEGWTTPVDTRMQALGGAVIRHALADVLEQQRSEEVAAMKADIARLKEEMASAKAERRSKLRERIHGLEQRIDEQQKEAQDWLEAFQQRQRAKRELLKRNASNAARAIKELAKTPL